MRDESHHAGSHLPPALKEGSELIEGGHWLVIQNGMHKSIVWKTPTTLVPHVTALMENVGENIDATRDYGLGLEMQPEWLCHNLVLRSRVSEHAANYLTPQKIVGAVKADETALPHFHHQLRGNRNKRIFSAAVDLLWKSVWGLSTFGTQSIPLSEVPEGQKILRLMRVYAAKTDVSVRLLKLEAHIVAAGCIEISDLTRAEEYSPVMSMFTVQDMLVSILQRKKARAWQYDDESAYVPETKCVLYAHWETECPQRAQVETSAYLQVWEALNSVIDSSRCYYEEWVECQEILGFQRTHHDQCYVQLAVLEVSEYTAGTAEDDFSSFSFRVDDGIVTQESIVLFEWFTLELDGRCHFCAHGKCNYGDCNSKQAKAQAKAKDRARARRCRRKHHNRNRSRNRRRSRRRLHHGQPMSGVIEQAPIGAQKNSSSLRV